MKKDFFAIIVALMIIALLGIIGIQIMWLNNAVKIKQAQTDQSINEALSQVVDKIETHETVSIIAKNHSKKSVKKTSKPIKKVEKISNNSNEIHIESIEELEALGDNFGEELGEKLEDQIESFIENIDTEFNFNLNINTNEDENGDTNESFELKSSDNAFVLSLKDDNFSIKINQLIDSKKEQVDLVMEQIINENILQDQSLIERIDTAFLVQELEVALINKGFTNPFDLAVINEQKDSVIYSSKEDLSFSKKTKYKTELFPNDIIDKDLVLYVNIEGTSSEIYKSMMLPLVGSVLFIVIILLVFIMALVTIYRQKKISEIKTDFINNMTHEFKTPIATISLAVDSIENEKVISEADKVRYFTKIIKEENRRMNYQVENVLQASLIDKSEFELNFQIQDVSPLITKTVNNIKLQIEQRQGTINLDFQAQNHQVLVDEIHFTNVINNLLDNANKYSPKQPEIFIKTRNQEGTLLISIRDNGLGMNKEVKSKIFDKFYRQTHGNIHNVKGFGLGLSYVSAIINKFKGKITVDSKEGQGSSFCIELPNYKL